MAFPDRALPLLRQAWKDAAEPDAKRRCAQVLALMGDATGAETLVDAVANGKWDKGWRFRGFGQFGRSSSPFDDLVIALGRTGVKEALGPILARAKELDASKMFSHHRAVALACEALGDPAAAPVLAAVLAKPGMTGYSTASVVKKENRRKRRDFYGDKWRSLALREIYVARALYRCGDHEGLGEKILRTYARDSRGPYARHALAVLKARDR
jgi:hypothetical protein